MITAATTQRRRLAETVILGKNGYLFHTDHESVEQVTGRLPLEWQELRAWQEATEARSAWCRANGVVFRMLIVPEKHVVYDDMLPDAAISPDRPALQLLAALSPRVRREVLYPAALLKQARASSETYFRTDTHWTEQGGFIAYQALLDSLPSGFIETPVQATELGTRDRAMIGDLAVRLEPEPEEVAVSLYHLTHRPFVLRYHNKGVSRGSTIAYEGDPCGKRMLAFRDSFFNYLIPHLIPALARLVAVSSIDVHYDLVASERPDIIVFEIAERFLGNLDGEGHRSLPTDPQGAFETLSGISPAALLTASAA